MKETENKEKRKSLLIDLLIILFFTMLAFTAINYIGNLREHGQDSVSVLFTPGRGSAENLVNSINISFALFLTLSFAILLSFKKEKHLKKIIYSYIASLLFLIGFLYSLWILTLSNSTGTGIGLDRMYMLIRILIIGIGFFIVSIIDYFKN